MYMRFRQMLCEERDLDGCGRTKLIATSIHDEYDFGVFEGYNSDSRLSRMHSYPQARPKWTPKQHQIVFIVITRPDENSIRCPEACSAVYYESFTFGALLGYRGGISFG
jgi:hypothetical protein